MSPKMGVNPFVGYLHQDRLGAAVAGTQPRFSGPWQRHQYSHRLFTSIVSRYSRDSRAHSGKPGESG